MNTPKVSVILPNYNRESYIGTAIESVLNQTYRNLELIVVDDGSTDNSLEVVARYKDDRLKLISLHHIGFPGIVRNRGIEVSKGEFIAFIDSDDVWDKEKLEMQVNLLESDPEVGLVHTDYRTINEKGQIVTHSGLRDKLISCRYPATYMPSGWCFKELLTGGNFVYPPTAVVKKEIIDKIGSFDPSIKQAEDVDFVLRIARLYPIGFIDKPLYQYRLHTSNMTRNSIEYYTYVIMVLTKAIQTNPSLNHELSLLVNQRIGNYYFYLSRECFGVGQYKDARRYALKAITYNPAEPVRYMLFIISLFGSKTLFWSCKRINRFFTGTAILKHELS